MQVPVQEEHLPHSMSNDVEAHPSLGCLMRSLTPPGLLLVDGAPVKVVVPSLGSSLAFLCIRHGGGVTSS